MRGYKRKRRTIHMQSLFGVKFEGDYRMKKGTGQEHFGEYRREQNAVDASRFSLSFRRTYYRQLNLSRRGSSHSANESLPHAPTIHKPDLTTLAVVVCIACSVCYRPQCPRVSSVTFFVLFSIVTLVIIPPQPFLLTTSLAIYQRESNKLKHSRWRMCASECLLIPRNTFAYTRP